MGVSVTTAILLLTIFVLALAFGYFLVTADDRRARRDRQDERRHEAELLYALRLIDRMLAADSVMPSLPGEIRNEASRFLAKQYKQIDEINEGDQ